jgi:hypothetical protein
MAQWGTSVRRAEDPVTGLKFQVSLYFAGWADLLY